MTESQELFVHPGLPMDVMQTVLGYISDTRSMAAARQVCKSWHAASSAATATVSVNLPGNIQDMRSKLALLLHVMPNLAGCHLTVGSGAAAAYPAECFRQLLSFPALKSLDLRFSDSLDLTSDDITQLACLTALSRLHLFNISLAAATDSSPLLLLKDLSELSLVHHSKVSALLVGDSHLSVLGQMTGLTDLVLQGRMCSASDSGLLALSGLTQLHSLAISWVPWQSQITQGAALQLLSALKNLKTLQLGGAELLLPNIPHFPVAAVHAPPAPPAPAAATALAVHAFEAPQPVLLPQLSSAFSVNTATAAAGGNQTDVMRSMLLAKAAELAQFKLQFNCCGTGVEKALLALGDVSGKLTGLQWSYAKLTGPNSTNLLAQCTSLTSLKLRLWYQDYNLRPFKFNLSHLTTLTNLRSLVIDKRPPFQQQLPVQQGAINMTLTPAVLEACTKSWKQLQKLQLGLSRSDFGPAPLQGLSGFTQLKSLSIHCYDQGYDDGQYMLPIDITCLPSSLIKVDLMHAELFSGGAEDLSDGCSPTSSSSSCSRASSSSSSSSSSQRRRELLSSGGSVSAGSSSSLKRCDSSCGATSKHSCCSSGSSSSKSAGKVSFAAASAHAFTSMLSESFSVLSRQASVDCSAAYIDQLPQQPLQQQQQQQVQAYYAQLQQQQQQQQQVQSFMQATGPGVSAFASAGGAAAAAAAAATNGSNARLVSSSSTAAAVESHNSWLHDLMHSLPSIPADSTCSNDSDSSGSVSAATTAVAPAAAAAAAVVSPAVDRSFLGSNSLSPRQSLPPLPEQRAVSQQAQEAARMNPFAAADVAAAVHEAIGGCVAAVEPAMLAPAAAAADVSDTKSSKSSRDQDKLPKCHSSKCTAADNSSSSSSSSSSKSAGKLAASQSVMPTVFKPNSSSSSSSSSKSAGGVGEVLVQRAYLPHLQQLQLKHCSLVGVALDDIITKPLELRVLQLIEVCGLSPRDIALLPYLATLHRLTLIAAREDAWLGLAPLRLFAKLPELRHLDWVVSEKALSGRHAKAPELQALIQYPKLQVLTVHTLLGRCEQLHAVSGQLRAGCAVRLMTPAFCEHATKKSGFGIGRLLGVASCLLPGTVPVL